MIMNIIYSNNNMIKVTDVEEEEMVEEEDIDLGSPIAWCINAWKPINIINFCLDSSREHEQLAVED